LLTGFVGSATCRVIPVLMLYRWLVDYIVLSEPVRMRRGYSASADDATDIYLFRVTAIINVKQIKTSSSAVAEKPCCSVGHFFGWVVDDGVGQ